MIAIPVNSAIPGAESSKLFGNVEMFAIYNPKDKTFFFVNNLEAGDGIKTAKQMKKWNVKSVAYSYMGKGPFTALQEDGVEIYYIGKEPMPLPDIIQEMGKGAFVKVDKNNASTYLDPGTPTGECTCNS
jgi:predicted Fe-Mo cluster-binding NifX family protein